MNRNFNICLLFASLLLWASPVFADNVHREPESSKKHYEIHMDEVVVSLPMQDKISSSAKPVEVLHNEELTMKTAPTIGGTLQQQQGIHGQSFGPNVGLPVIRGQSGPRVRVLNNGLGTNDASQASPDHASTANPLAAERIEVLRGPATLLYGSGSIGGVVNVIDNRIPMEVPDKVVGGTLDQRYNSVSNETSTAIKLKGGEKYFAYHLDGFYRDNGDIDIDGPAIDVPRASISEPGLDVTRNTNGFIDNTNSDAKGGSVGMSLVGDAGVIGVAGNLFKTNYGIPPEGTDDAELARIDLDQGKFDFKAEYLQPISIINAIKTKFSYTDYEHTEGAEGEIEALFENTTWEGRVEMPHTLFEGLDGVIGIQAISSVFSAIEIEENETIVPRTSSQNLGVFAQEGMQFGPVDTQIGLRIEHATSDPDLMNMDRSFTPISASGSALWNINEEHSVNLAFTRSQRAPQAQELFIEGFHEATRSFQRGNPNLTLETSHNLDLGYKFVTDWIIAEVDFFHNWISNYIFLQRSGALVDGAPETLHRQTGATFIGYEARAIIPAMDNNFGTLDVTLFSDFVRGQLTNNDDIPQQPPLRYGFQVDHSLGNWNSFLRLTRAEDQENPGPFEAETPDYVLLNLGTHYHVDNLYGADVMAYVKGNNLLDERILNSTSFLRNFAPEAGRGAEIGVRITY